MILTMTMTIQYIHYIIDNNYEHRAPDNSLVDSHSTPVYNGELAQNFANPEIANGRHINVQERRQWGVKHQTRTMNRELPELKLVSLRSNAKSRRSICHHQKHFSCMNPSLAGFMIVHLLLVKRMRTLKKLPSSQHDMWHVAKICTAQAAHGTRVPSTWLLRYASFMMLCAYIRFSGFGLDCHWDCHHEVSIYSESESNLLRPALIVPDLEFGGQAPSHFHNELEK